jgi:hypothetical protein
MLMALRAPLRACVCVRVRGGQTMRSTQSMADAMKGVAKAMRSMNKQINLPGIQKVRAGVSVCTHAGVCIRTCAHTSCTSAYPYLCVSACVSVSVYARACLQERPDVALGVCRSCKTLSSSPRLWT